MVSFTQFSIAQVSPDAEQGHREPRQERAKADSMLKGKVDLLEKSADANQNQGIDKPIFNRLAASQAVNVEIPHLGWSRKTKPFTIGANDTGWVASLPGVGIQTPAFSEGSVFVGGGRDKHGTGVFALDARTGETIWHFNHGERWPTAVVVDNGLCAFNTNSCSAFVLNATTGKVVWQKRLAMYVDTQPAIKGDFIYLTFHPILRSYSCLECRTLDRGHLVWQAQFPGKPVSAPIIDKDRAYVASSNGTVECCDAATGKTIWANPMQASSAPLLLNGTVIAAQDDVGTRTLASFGYDGGRPAIAQNSIIRIKDNSIEADDIRDGRELWKTELDEHLCRRGLFGPSVGKHDIYLTTGSGYIITLNSKTGKEEHCYATRQSFDCQPCLAQGNLYVGTHNGKLLCFPMGEDADGWSCWGGNAQHNI
jgi:eukaryotic-like serine/threonine-protein kinase